MSMSQLNTMRTLPLKDLIEFSISCLGLSIRASNCLHTGNIYKLKELIVRSEVDLLNLPNMGELSIAEIKGSLKACGLKLELDLTEKYNKITDKEKLSSLLYGFGIEFDEVKKENTYLIQYATKITDQTAETTTLFEFNFEGSFISQHATM